MALWQVSVGGQARLARGDAAEGPATLLPAHLTIDGLLSGTRGAFVDALAGADDGPVPAEAVILPPIGTQEVWASGVTYRRSRDARMEESSNPDHYDLVYDAPRPELFFKSTAARVRGPNAPIGIRADSTWDVPEAELGLVVDAHGDIVGYVIGDDVSSRSIEGENPLYLPQAKTYTGSCSLGPCIVPVNEAPPTDQMTIRLEIRRAGEPVYDDDVSVAQMHRSPAELVDWLVRAIEFPVGAVLLTGTALVPPSTFTLQAKDEVTITITGLGSLTNHVEVVGRTEPR